MKKKMLKNAPLISILTFVDSIIDQWQSALSTIDPEYGYQNEMREDEALKLKQEFRELINLLLENK